jgi:hypothetical protein
MTARMRRGGTCLFTLSWNEAPVLPFFFRHYDPWVDRYIIFDDGSIDGTLDLLAAHPRVEVRRFSRAVPDSFVESHRVWQNNVWKEVRGQADWVVLTAIDEHLWHPDITGYLRRCKAAGVTAIPALGFNMIADGFPPADTHLAETLRRGMPHSEMNKLSLFDPGAIAETNFGPGRHVAAPAGRVAIPATDEVLNLHYKYLGRDYVAARNGALRSGLGVGDLREGYGEQYGWSREKLDTTWDQMQARVIDYRDPSVGFATHVDRWWRPRRRPG